MLADNSEMASNGTLMTYPCIVERPNAGRPVRLATVALLLVAELGLAGWVDSQQRSLQQRVAHLEAVIDTPAEYHASILPRAR